MGTLHPYGTEQNNHSIGFAVDGAGDIYEISIHVANSNAGEKILYDIFTQKKKGRA